LAIAVGEKCHYLERMPDAPSQLAYPHLTVDERGVAWIEGTNTKVIEVVLDRLAHGLSAEEIHLEHPHVSLAGIHMALAYYHDHQEELDGVIRESLAQARRERQQSMEASALRQRLLDRGLL
jgi:uncharacterized protein (DUF433 family)